MRVSFVCVLAMLMLGMASCTDASAQGGSRPMSLVLQSAAIPSGGTIPTEHTCDGADRSPPLSWAGVPNRTQSFALIVDDPDAPRGTWVHWVLFDLPAETRLLRAGAGAAGSEPAGARQGRNDFGRVGYGGPCPPQGPAHRYAFKLYALDRRLGLPEGATKADVEHAMRGHVLADGSISARYARAREATRSPSR